MKGRCTTPAAVDVSLGSLALLDGARSNCPPPSHVHSNSFSNSGTDGISRAFRMKVKARKAAEDLKRFKSNFAGSQIPELFSREHSSFPEQRKLDASVIKVGRGGSGLQPFAAWRGQDVVDTKTFLDVTTVNDNRNREEVFQPPRLCTLREFREGGGVIAKADSDDLSPFLKTLAANAEALVQVRNFELLSGRFAMIAFAFALGMEYVTGKSVFKGIDFQKFGELAVLCAAAATSAGIFAVAWGAKAQISVFMSRGYQNLVDTTVDTIVDGLFYDDS